MKTDMRRELARQRFEEKIRKVGQLIQLSAKLKRQRTANNVDFDARGLRPQKNATKKILAAERNQALGGIRSSFPPFGGSQS